MRGMIPIIPFIRVAGKKHFACVYLREKEKKKKGEGNEDQTGLGGLLSVKGKGGVFLGEAALQALRQGKKGKPTSSTGFRPSAE